MFGIPVVGSTDNMGAGRDNSGSVSYVCCTAGGRAAPCQSTCPGESACAAARERYISGWRDYSCTVRVSDGCGAACWVVDEDGGGSTRDRRDGWVSGLNSRFLVSCQVGVDSVRSPKNVHSVVVA